MYWPLMWILALRLDTSRGALRKLCQGTPVWKSSPCHFARHWPCSNTPSSICGFLFWSSLLEQPIHSVKEAMSLSFSTCCLRPSKHDAIGEGTSTPNSKRRVPTRGDHRTARGSDRGAAFRRDCKVIRATMCRTGS